MAKNQEVIPTPDVLAKINAAHVALLGGNQFAPPDGFCYHCRRQIYDTTDRIAQAVERPVTGCPHCHYSFVE